MGYASPVPLCDELREALGVRDTSNIGVYKKFV
jgi:hypothetical protein